ncbi:hypothetical protein H0178_52880 [Cytobacillus firmus]|nr:hypothetical protein [Cytobacillus firmus]
MIMYLDEESIAMVAGGLPKNGWGAVEPGFRKRRGWMCSNSEYPASHKWLRSRIGRKRVWRAGALFVT